MSELEPIIPTFERAQHEPVRQVDEAIADQRGDIGNPYRVHDILLRLLLRGDITREMAQAGDDFRRDFYAGLLQELQAAPMDRPFVSGAGINVISPRAERARRKVRQMLDLVGGVKSLCGSCLWHVIGEEYTLDRWRAEVNLIARGSKPLGRNGALKVLIRALEQIATANECVRYSAEIRAERTWESAT